MYSEIGAQREGWTFLQWLSSLKEKGSQREICHIFEALE